MRMSLFLPFLFFPFWLWAGEPVLPLNAETSDSPSFDSIIVVIASNGLKLRASPSMDAKVLTVMPFRQAMKLLEIPVIDPETGNPYDFNGDVVSGQWFRVRYKQFEGYALSTFLARNILEMHENVYLLSPNGSWCSNDAYISATYHFYGVFREVSGRFSRRRIIPQFRSFWGALDGYIDCWVHLKVDGEQPDFILASRTKMSEGLLKTTGRSGCIPPRDPTCWDSIDVQPVIYKSRWIFSFESNPEEGVKVRDKTTGIWQFLPAEKYYFFTSLVWEGDLDGDGQMDFILSAPYEIGETWHLFLTRGKKKGMLVREYGWYRFSGCC